MITKSVSRFAPSPTGRLHLGHAYSALRAHDLAEAGEGRFLLRIEDIDQTRCRPEHVDGIYEDLCWLGLNWDRDVVFQSDRHSAYAAALDRIVTQGLAYRCWCTRAEVAANIDAPQGDVQPVYPGTCKGRGDPGDGRPYSWRLDVAEAVHRAGQLEWFDADAAEVKATPDRLGDVVIARKDAPAAYHLAVVVDDGWQGVTDVVRGRDLFDSTHIHRLIQHILDIRPPAYHHHKLIMDVTGTRLAKRKHAPTLAAMREDGVDPEALVAGLRAGVLPDGFCFSD
jgi:glutamyl-Q tRNA(Asp) synthetase